MELPKNATREEIGKIVADLIGELTLEEKVTMMSGHGFFDPVTGGFTSLSTRSFRAGGGNERLGVPTVQFADGPRGVVVKGSTCFPVTMARGASWDPALEERIGEAIGKEMRVQGGNLYGGVCINLLRHPAWGRAQETYGEDPHHLGEMGAALVRGVQRHNVMATIKHFAANSIENARFKVDVQLGERVLREVYLPHFKRCVDEGAATVMSAYNKVNGAYCGHNAVLLNQILKDEWGFEGFVHSDWIKGVYGPDAAAAGLDVENPEGRFFGETLVAEVKAGAVAESAVDEAVRRILTTLFRYLSAEDPQEYGLELLACPEHAALAREAAEKGAVLLKNEGDFLPLDRGAVKRVALIGSLADRINTGDLGSSNVRAPYVVTPRQGIEAHLEGSAEVHYDDGSSPEAAAQAAADADVAIVVVGYTHKDEGEYITSDAMSKEPNPGGPQYTIGGDRDVLTLHPEDEDLIFAVAKANPRTVVAVMGGSAVMMGRWREAVPGILMLWYPGMEGGAALARLLFGEASPGGRLPFTIPKDAGQLPFFDKDADSIEYGLFHGYTKFDREGLEAAFAFGFGLTYTTFAYSDAQASAGQDGIDVSVKVTNTGSRAGEEVVQLYVGFENSKIERPQRLLRGFQKISLDPGETKEVRLRVVTNDLAWYNPEASAWEVEQMEYTASVGGSSTPEDLLTVSFSI